MQQVTQAETNPNAESVRKFQPRVALWQPWDNYFEDATLKGLRAVSAIRLVVTPQDCETLIVNGVEEISPRLAKFHWQGGYGAFSVSQSNLDEVVRYIENQEEHHKRVTFQDEYQAFLKAYDIAYDERYVWD